MQWTIRLNKKAAINAMMMGDFDFDDWGEAELFGYRAFEITISYEKPQAGDEEG